MKVTMEFDRKQAELIIAMCMNVSTKVTKAMSDEKLIQKAFEYASTYGFCNMEIVDDIRKV